MNKETTIRTIPYRVLLSSELAGKTWAEKKEAIRKHVKLWKAYVRSLPPAPMNRHAVRAMIARMHGKGVPGARKGREASRRYKPRQEPQAAEVTE